MSLLAGVSGATIKLDQFGDSEGNFSVLALKKEPFRRDNFSCDYQMKPVGQFQQGETLVSELFVAFKNNAPCVALIEDRCANAIVSATWIAEDSTRTWNEYVF